MHRTFRVAGPLCRGCWIPDEFREGRLKTSDVPDNIDVVFELTMQDRHVTTFVLQLLKKSSCRLVNRKVRNKIAVFQTTFIRASQVTNHGVMRMCMKQSTVSSWKTSQILKVVCEKRTSKKMVACFIGMWRLSHLSNVGRSILSGTPQFVC